MEYSVFKRISHVCESDKIKVLLNIENYEKNKNSSQRFAYVVLKDFQQTTYLSKFSLKLLPRALDKSFKSNQIIEMGQMNAYDKQQCDLDRTMCCFAFISFYFFFSVFIYSKAFQIDVIFTL